MGTHVAYQVHVRMMYVLPTYMYFNCQHLHAFMCDAQKLRSEGLRPLRFESWGATASSSLIPLITYMYVHVSTNREMCSLFWCSWTSVNLYEESTSIIPTDFQRQVILQRESSNNSCRNVHLSILYNMCKCKCFYIIMYIHVHPNKNN